MKYSHAFNKKLIAGAFVYKHSDVMLQQEKDRSNSVQNGQATCKLFGLCLTFLFPPVKYGS